MRGKLYKQARVLCEDTLQHMDKFSQSTPSDRVYLLQSLATLKLENNEGASACLYLKKALNIASSKSLPTVELSIMLVKAYMSDKEYEDALTTINGVLSILSFGHSQLEPLALKAEILFELGRPAEAGEVINRCITPPLADVDGNMNHIIVLTSYGYISMSCQPPLVQQPLHALLKALSLDPKTKRVRSLLAKLLDIGHSSNFGGKWHNKLKEPYGMGLQELYRQLTPRESVAAAYVLLSGVCKDHSAMKPCIHLLETAVSFRVPNSANHALSLAHAYEVVGEYEAALQAMHQYSSQASASLSGGASTVSLSAQTLCQLVPPLKDSAIPAADRCLLEWVNDAVEVRSFDPQDEQFLLPIIECAPGGEASRSSIEATFDDDGRSLLAMSFTAAKIYFLLGKFGRLVHLFRLVEPARLVSQQPLHTTDIRNEHAYYQSIAQLLAYRCQLFRSQVAIIEGGALAMRKPLQDIDESLLRAGGGPLYVLGDSHCLSAAWNVVTVAGQQRLLVPKLVTGVKQWHLRAESDFYPKANFFSAVDSIPDGADVILSVGEIDCREGMLMAVER